MADAKISALTNLTAADAINDMIPIVDVSDTPPASGNTKRISINNLLSSSPTASGALTITGLVTAGSATITGALGAAGLNVTGATIPANGVYLGSANNLSFSAASTLGMTLNSTGLGVGVVTAAGKLQVALGAVASVPAAGATGHNFAFGSVPFGLAGGALSSGNSYLQATRWDGTATNYDLVLNPNGGNVGVGVVTAAGNFEVSEAGTGSGLGGIFASTVNAGGNPGYVFRTAGTNRWAINIAGTAGTESLRFYDINAGETRMLIDTSGNLLVGVPTTPPALAVNSQMVFNLTSNTNLRISVRGTDGTTRTANITLA